MTAPRLLLVHDRPRADGGEPRHCDRLLKGTRYVIEWSVPIAHRLEDGATADCMTVTYPDVEWALEEWYAFPREDERRVGRAPKGFEAARRKAREG